jgi:hypothetical protein
MRVHVLLIFLVLSACKNNPKLTRYYKSTEPVTTIPVDLVEVSILSISKPKKTTEATLLKLTDEGQSKFIEVLSKGGISSNELLKLLGKSIGKSNTSSPHFQDKTIVNRRIVLSTILKDISRGLPGDRITRLDCTLNNLSNAGKFKSWDLFSTKYGSVNLGDLTLTSVSGGSFSINATSAETSGDPVARGGTLTPSSTLVETYSQIQRFIELTGIMNEHEARFFQESPQGRNLTGNSFIDIEFDLDSSNSENVVSMPNLKLKNGNWNTQDKIKIVEKQLFLPQVIDVNANLNCNYVVRRPFDHKSRRTPAEGDDKAQYITGHIMPQTVKLIPSEALKTNLLVIQNSGTRDKLQIKLPLASPTLKFESYDHAHKFLTWLIASNQGGNLKVMDHELLINNTPITSVDLSTLLISLDK